MLERFIYIKLERLIKSNKNSLNFGRGIRYGFCFEGGIVLVKKKTSDDDEHRRSIRFKAKSIEEMQKIAVIQNVTVSDVVREYIEKGLKVDSYKEDTDFITEIIRQELKDILEPQINRIVKMLMKIGKVAAGTMYSNLSLIQLINDEDQEAYFELVSRSLKLGVDYMKKKDVEVDAYLGNTEDVIKDGSNVNVRKCEF